MVMLSFINFVKYFKIIFQNVCVGVVVVVNDVLGGEYVLKENPEGRRHRACLGNKLDPECVLGLNDS